MTGTRGRHGVLFFLASLMGCQVLTGLDGLQQSADAGPADASTPDASEASAFDPVVQVAGGQGEMCALTAGGDVYCWGRADDGVVWPGASVTGTMAANCSSKTLGPHLCQPVPTKVPGLDHIIQLGEAAIFGQCALRDDGASPRTVLCWGNNAFALMGHTSGLGGDTTCPSGAGFCHPTPTVITALATLQPVSQLGVGDGWACVLSQAKEVWCWGRNDFGNLGQGSYTTAVSAVPVKVLGLSGVTSLSVGPDSRACAVAMGEAYCWGQNGFPQAPGALGHTPGTHGDQPCPANPNDSCNATPMPMDQADNTTPITGLTVIQTGVGTCAFGDGGLACNALPNLFSSPTPALTSVAGFPTGIVAFESNSLSLCTLGSGGDVWCGGGDYDGELGDGNINVASATPFEIEPGDVRSMHTDSYQGADTFLTMSDGTVIASGANYFGQLGIPPGAEGDSGIQVCSGCFVRPYFAPIPNLP